MTAEQGSTKGLVHSEAALENANSSEKISVIASVYNFENSVRELYLALTQALKKNGTEYELIFVDDGSQDSTYKFLVEIESADARVRIVKMRSTFGEAANFDAGIKIALGTTIIYLTGRVRISANGLIELLKTLHQGYDMVIGWRSPRADSKLNQIISGGFNALARKFSGLNYHDINSGVLVAKREVLENLPIYGSFSHFLPLLAVRKGYKVTETKIEQLRGEFRQSRYFREYVQRLLDILTVVFLTRYSKKPIHFLGFLGTLFTLIGLGCNLYLLLYRLLEIGPIGGRPLLLFSAFFLVTGIQMISIGLIGEMIIFTHARDIKEYNIEKILD
ncbi:glycosyltransferase [candidate division KSB1 bacterium]|nr:glycosyltransferase [candidate division KSB1 bacterium]